MLFSALLLFSVAARAESNRFNLHVTPGALLSNQALGADVGVGFDWQFLTGLALDVRLSTQVVSDGFAVGPVLNPALGLRLRFLDDHQGYQNEKHGNSAGHLALAPHVGAVIGIIGAGVTFDAELGYEWSIARPFQLGAFVRPMLGFGTFCVMGGASVGVAMSFGFGPEMGLDRDGDGVGDERDRCPDTPAGVEVDGRGCTIIRHVMVLEGILFKLNSADIEPDSERTLQRALTALRDNPQARVEIGGHTDDTGTAERNDVLSAQRAQSVASWLTAHGVEARRLTSKGYGSSKPKVKNSDDVSRAVNRRIEFTRLDE
jgi:outer membrane protein OmpA-like peptidoglycan-associated protein